MGKKQNTSAAAELRSRAEERLRAGNAEAAAPTAKDALRLVHELQVHQIELEMQNEELRQARAEVEAGLERFTDLYDFAPVGYLTLGRDGSIRQLNLAGASMLGAERVRLSGRRFGDFVGEADRGGFQAFLKKHSRSSRRKYASLPSGMKARGRITCSSRPRLRKTGRSVAS